MSNDYIATLTAMHTYRRPHGTRTEQQFCDRFLKPLPGAWRDEYGNYHCQIGSSPLLWSSHTDTVHYSQGRQRVRFSASDGMLSLAPKSKYRGSSCLGSDDTIGVWLMTELIKRNVPGYYLFHYGEESGGIGSRSLVRNHGDWLEQFQCAIALDRRGYNDVITHQGFDRSASTAFAQSLSDHLNSHGLHYKPCDTGTYTDTAEYTDFIAECTNLSVGYFRAHSRDEETDLYHAIRLLEALSTLTLDKLVIERTPGDTEFMPFWSGRWNDDALYLDPAFAEVQRYLSIH